MGIKEDYQQALSLARGKQYSQAKLLLKQYDTAETNLLLAKIEDAMRDEQRTPPKPSVINWTNIIGWGFIIFIICNIVSLCSYILIVNN